MIKKLLFGGSIALMSAVSLAGNDLNQELSSLTGNLVEQSGEIKSRLVEKIDFKDYTDLSYNPYEITLQKFIYTGEIPNYTENFEIYKGINEMVEDEKIKNIITSLKIEQFDLSALKNTKLTNISLKEENGYRVNLDFEGGYIGVYKDYSYSYFKSIENMAKDYQRISDEEAISIVNDFVKKFKINVSKFGQPYVEKQEFAKYDSSYIDQYVQVVFPTKINGKNVNERFGQNAGLRISVSNIDKSIQGFSLKVEKLIKANDANLITDINRINKIIEKGGYEYEYDYGNEYTIKYEDINLKNARIEYVKIDTYIDSFNTYYGPAILFDVDNNEQLNYYQDKIIIPLIDKAYENIK